MEVIRPDLITSALTWLERGAALLPAQPNSKKLCPGFGPYLRKITKPEGVEKLWGKHPKLNLAVIAPPSLLMLDFDDSALCGRWQDEIPSSYCLTYQETTPHGWRVFYWCDFRPGPGIKFVPGVEIKQFCLVSPSKLQGFIYTPIDPTLPILEVSDPSRILFPLLSELPQPQAAHNLEIGAAARAGGSGAVIERIKAAIPILDMVSFYADIKFRKDRGGRWRTGCCPFHDDKKPSLWVDTERQLFGCHACGVHGDVINFYARIKNLTIQAAIRELAAKYRV